MKRIYIIQLGFLFTLGSCAYNKSEGIKPLPPNCPPADSVSFSKNILPILNNNCSTSGCHTGVNAEANFNLDASVAFTTLTNPRKGYINTENPKLSVLYSSLVSVSQPMPPNGRLSDCELDQIVSWMKNGAKND
jgi:hypothetical protein